MIMKPDYKHGNREVFMYGHLTQALYEYRIMNQYILQNNGEEHILRLGKHEDQWATLFGMFNLLHFGEPHPHYHIRYNHNYRQYRNDISGTNLFDLQKLFIKLHFRAHSGSAPIYHGKYVEFGEGQILDYIPITWFVLMGLVGTNPKNYLNQISMRDLRTLVRRQNLSIKSSGSLDSDELVKLKNLNAYNLELLERALRNGIGTGYPTRSTAPLTRVVGDWGEVYEPITEWFGSDGSPQNSTLKTLIRGLSMEKAYPIGFVFKDTNILEFSIGSLEVLDSVNKAAHTNPDWTKLHTLETDKRLIASLLGKSTVAKPTVITSSTKTVGLHKLVAGLAENNVNYYPRNIKYGRHRLGKSYTIEARPGHRVDGSLTRTPITEIDYFSTILHHNKPNGGYNITIYSGKLNQMRLPRGRKDRSLSQELITSINPGRLAIFEKAKRRSMKAMVVWMSYFFQKVLNGRYDMVQDKNYRGGGFIETPSGTVKINYVLIFRLRRLNNMFIRCFPHLQQLFNLWDPNSLILDITHNWRGEGLFLKKKRYIKKFKRSALYTGERASRRVILK